MSVISHKNLPRVHTPEMTYIHMFNGWLYLSSNSNYDDVDEGESPEGRYVGFKVLTGDVSIESITFTSDDLYTFDGEEDITDLPLIEGETYYMLFKQIKLNGGSILIIKE